MPSNIVVIFGSGASHASGYKVRVKGEVARKFLIQAIAPPTDQSFFADIPGEFLEDEYYALWKFKRLLFATNASVGMEEVWSTLDLNHKHIKLETYNWSKETQQYTDIGNKYPNMDIAISHLVLGQAFDTSPQYSKYKFLGDCGRDFRRLIYNVYSPYEISRDQSRFRSLHESLEASKLILIGYISFNYDCYLEDSLEDRELTYVGDNANTDSIETLLHGGIPIIKLHGSLSWKEVFDGTLHRVTFNAPPYTPEKQVEPNYQNDFDWCQPAIIAPTLFKQEINDDSRTENSLTQTMLQQWRGAITLLREADRIMFVGYSFPSSDFHSRRIFQVASMLRRSRTGEAIKILDCVGSKDDKGKKKKLFRNIFGDTADIAITRGFENLLGSKEFEEFLIR